MKWWQQQGRKGAVGKEKRTLIAYYWKSNGKAGPRKGFSPLKLGGEGKEKRKKVYFASPRKLVPERKWRRLESGWGNKTTSGENAKKDNNLIPGMVTSLEQQRGNSKRRIGEDKVEGKTSTRVAVLLILWRKEGGSGVDISVLSWGGY